MTRYGIVVLTAVSLLTAPLAAQPKLPVAIDQRVRLWTEAAEAVTGRVVAVTPALVERLRAVTAGAASRGRDAATAPPER